LYKENFVEDGLKIVDLRERKNEKLIVMRDCLKKMAKNELDSSTLRIKYELL